MRLDASLRTGLEAAQVHERIARNLHKGIFSPGTYHAHAPPDEPFEGYIKTGRYEIRRIAAQKDLLPMITVVVGDTPSGTVVHMSVDMHAHMTRVYWLTFGIAIPIALAIAIIVIASSNWAPDNTILWPIAILAVAYLSTLWNKQRSQYEFRAVKARLANLLVTSAQ